jgi:hypothetical protein
MSVPPAVDLDHGRLVGVHQAGEAADEPAHHLVVDHGIPRLVGKVVDRLGVAVEHGALAVLSPGRTRAVRVGAQVETRTEARAASGHQDHVDVGIEVGALNAGRQFQWSRGDDGVALFGPVEGDPRDASGDLVGHRGQGVSAHRPTSGFTPSPERAR